ncbi:autotransporter [Caulobacter sp. Root1455]|uniref:autotransporter outer membrane beta-barrel domain-containing protein n=1 Tax=unclassified Caulobacter TaxID=2648921 RepID=UPI0006FEDD8E|nr:MULTISPECIES: autotransporter outer membrane beta-barrel domain-containing protein [unclassified Caulobacter]KQY35606.1 autotransporter [Caulobacter sp. Root487D2Y]KQZ06428.1 autotransporter [Caulobacter sp. Root1455]
MQRKVLVATVATAPLLAMAFGAYAETVINTARTTPIATATATAAAGPDDVKVDTGGGITLTTAGPLITLNSNNKVSIGGNGLTSVGVNDSTGVLIQGGMTGSVINNAAISLTEDYTPTDDDKDASGAAKPDGDLDGPFAKGSNRYGIHLVGPGVFTGDITQSAGGSITIEGNNSAGIWLETGQVGNLTTGGTINVIGDNTYGVRVAAPVTGRVSINGGTTVTGLNATGVAIDGAVSGAVIVQGGVTTTGYRYTTRPATKELRAILDADDLLQGGSAVRVTANVGGGILLDAPPLDTDTANTDEDGDGVADASEGTASLTTYGAAPALLIGSDTQSVAIGAVGTGDNAYGLIARGGVTANGVYDGVTATGIQIGGNAGQTTTIAGGARLDSAITATAYEANSTGVLVKAGATAPTLWNRGGITAFSVSEGQFDSRAVAIDAGASVTTLRNAGSISSTLGGEKGNAYGVIDNSGALTTIENTGRISATIVPTDDKDDTDDADLLASNEVVTGKAIAIDVSKNTTGVTLTQFGVNDGDDLKDGIADADADGDGVDNADEPTLIGAINFGSGADTFNLQNGLVVSDVAFGAGADALNISGGAAMLGAVRDSDGQLAINIGKGSLGLTNAETINATSLTLGADAKMAFTADPAAGTHTQLVVSGPVNIAAGAQLGLRLTSLLTTPTSYTVITGGTLTAGAINQDLLGDTPYLYVAGSRVDTNNVYLDVRRRTATEIGMNQSQASAYDATFAALSKDADIAKAYLAQTTKDGLLGLYDQMMPDQGEGFFAAMQDVSHAISVATRFRPDPGDRYGPDSLWIQEINTLVRRDTDETMGSDTQAFGFVGGYEAMGDAGGALGLTLAYVSIEEHDIAAKVGEQTTGNFVELGAYWRRAVGGWRFNLGGGGGYGWYDGDRTFNTGDLNGDGAADVQRHNSAKWNGSTFNAFAGMAYEAKFGRYFTRPEASLDYLYLSEGERKESGGGDGFDQIVHKRNSDSLIADAGIVFGADYGRDLWWRPEVRIGYRQLLAGEIGNTVAQYTNGGAPFTLASGTDKDGAVTLGFALRAGTPMSYLALEANAEAAKKQKRYNLKLTGRAMF